MTDNLSLQAHWTKIDKEWSISPTSGPSAGGTKVSLTPPDSRGMKFSQTSAGNSHTLAIGSDGNLYAWGGNEYGQLGDGTTTDRNKPDLVNKPTGVPDTFTYRQVSAGYYHSLAVGSDGNLYAWGDN